jgi:hypothetical protein
LHKSAWALPLFYKILSIFIFIFIYRYLFLFNDISIDHKEICALVVTVPHRVASRQTIIQLINQSSFRTEQQACSVKRTISCASMLRIAVVPANDKKPWYWQGVG